jgi:uncharacterized membrane protein
MDDPLLIPCSVFSNVFYDTLLVLVLCPSLVPFEQSIGIDWISCCYMWQLTAFRRISFGFVVFRFVSLCFVSVSFLTLQGFPQNSFTGTNIMCYLLSFGKYRNQQVEIIVQFYYLIEILPPIH